jgi:transcription-repair coupling factor (superfamily II helicase)
MARNRSAVVEISGPISQIDLTQAGTTELSGVPEGIDALVLADLARIGSLKAAPPFLLHVARDEQRLVALREALAFFAPDLKVCIFPAWDCLPYDRASPSLEVSATRIATLAALTGDGDKPDLVLATVNAVLQRSISPQTLSEHVRTLAPGQIVDMGALAVWLTEHGYERTATVRDPASFAVRGGILDVYPPNGTSPVRLDFFGDTLESIREFDPESQRTTVQGTEVDLLPVSEVLLIPECIQRFRSGYREKFGTVSVDDPVYEAISEGRRSSGMEHWLPLFHQTLVTLMDYLPGVPISLDYQATDMRQSRLELIDDYYEARNHPAETAGSNVAPYRALEPGLLYLDEAAWSVELDGRAIFNLSPFESAGESTDHSVSIGGRVGRTFAAERATTDQNLFDAVVAHIGAVQKQKRRVVVACWSEGSHQRMAQLLADHGLAKQKSATSWGELQSSPIDVTAFITLGLETGFETDLFLFLCEQDILGDRLARPTRSRKRDTNFLTEATSLSVGDFIVHVEHGIGRFDGLQTIDAAGAPHDCLALTYAGGDRLFVPVENIELLSRYGSDDSAAQLDRLGGAAWQARKARLKERIREIAGELIKTAATRAMRAAPVIHPPEGIYDEFCARFPFVETDDQLNAILAVFEDLAKGRPMDRLVCGDVGFGKTEIALRAAFVTVMAGYQVAIIVPTTLLARQHYKTFVERFAGLPVKIAQASRLVKHGEMARTREGLTSGDIDIVIGTHALLAKSIKFRELGLVVVDEEQHFGVTHKEQLKQFRAEVHVLTLTATPIPRTLQLALTGIRDLSIIATPPVDRLAIRTFVIPFDTVSVREAILREFFRGGQTFYVCPRVSDLGEAEAFLREHVPEVKIAVAHGQMAPQVLEDVMTAFYDGRYDVLISTTIIESGLDIPTANTLIVHRADMFGLAQLYQLRGRVGRSKQRAYALMTVPARRRLTVNAEKRLKVLQSLDQLGAGFMLASHDLDIRGGGNLLGEEQSGHIREVGFELYQSMLEEAVAQLTDDSPDAGGDKWSPQIAIGAAILLPDTYIRDLELRLGLYRRLSSLETEEELDAFAVEMVDRFGDLPVEANQLLRIVGIKILCRRAGIKKFDAGPRGATIAFRDNIFVNPAELVAFIAGEGKNAKLRSDHRLVVRRNWEDAEEQLAGATVMLRRISAIAESTTSA